MKNKIQKTAASIQKFAVAHKTDIAFVSGVAVTAALVHKFRVLQTEQYDDFIEAHGLKDAWNSQFADED